MSAQHERVLNALRDGSWLTANKIWAATGVTPTEMRRLCQEKQGSYISGPQGYKRADRATDIEISYCITDLMSRASAILERAATLERRRSYLNKPAKVLPA
jgi:hypothetical protein